MMITITLPYWLYCVIQFLCVLYIIDVGVNFYLSWLKIKLAKGKT